MVVLLLPGHFYIEYIYMIVLIIATMCKNKERSKHVSLSLSTQCTQHNKTHTWNLFITAISVFNLPHYLTSTMKRAFPSLFLSTTTMTTMTTMLRWWWWCWRGWHCDNDSGFALYACYVQSLSLISILLQCVYVCVCALDHHLVESTVRFVVFSLLYLAQPI